MERDTIRRITDKEIAGALKVSPRTLMRYKRRGLSLPKGLRTMGACLAAVEKWQAPPPVSPCVA